MNKIVRKKKAIVIENIKKQSGHNKVSPADVFIHLLSIIMLYTSATSFLVLIFQIVNVNLPDLMDQSTLNSMFITGAYAMIRGAIAFLIISYPVYLLSFWRVKKSYDRDPAKLHLRLRKWLIYFTLFITSLLIVGNLIALVIGFLHGDLTTRFLIKIVSVFFVAGSVFSYYMLDLKDTYKITLRILALFISAIVLAAIITGFFFVGSPQDQRLRRFDEQKIQALQMIDNEIQNYWLTNKKLPKTLKDIQSSSSNAINIKDAQTNKEYKYTVTDNNHYTICANFNKPSYAWDLSKKYSVSLTDYIWEYSEGEYCFKRSATALQKDIMPY